MLTTLTLSGVWLLGGHVLAFLVGLFSSTYIKDTLKGMPGQLRTALNAHEKTALTALKDAESKVVSDTMTKLGLPQPAAKAAPAAAAAKPAAPAVGADILAALKNAAKSIEDAATKLATPAPVAPVATTPAAPAAASPAASTTTPAPGASGSGT